MLLKWRTTGARSGGLKLQHIAISTLSSFVLIRCAFRQQAAKTVFKLGARFLQMYEEIVYINMT